MRGRREGPQGLLTCRKDAASSASPSSVTSCRRARRTVSDFLIAGAVPARGGLGHLSRVGLLPVVLERFPCLKVGVLVDLRVPAVSTTTPPPPSPPSTGGQNPLVVMVVASKSGGGCAAATGEQKERRGGGSSGGVGRISGDRDGPEGELAGLEDVAVGRQRGRPPAHGGFQLSPRRPGLEAC